MAPPALAKPLQNPNRSRPQSFARLGSARGRVVTPGTWTSWEVEVQILGFHVGVLVQGHRTQVASFLGGWVPSIL